MMIMSLKTWGVFVSWTEIMYTSSSAFLNGLQVIKVVSRETFTDMDGFAEIESSGAWSKSPI